MLGQPIVDADPRGRRLQAHRQAAARASTATDLVLTVTRCCASRASSASSSSSTAPASPTLPLADRATIAQHGARVRRDDAASSRSTTRRSTTCGSPAASAEQVALVEAYCQGAGPVPHRRDAPMPIYTDVARARPRRRSSRASPARAVRRIACRCKDAKASFGDVARRDARPSRRRTARRRAGAAARDRRRRRRRRAADQVDHGAVVDRRDHELHEHVEPVA